MAAFSHCLVRRATRFGVKAKQKNFFEIFLKVLTPMHELARVSRVTPQLQGETHASSFLPAAPGVPRHWLAIAGLHQQRHGGGPARLAHA
jgi:hypothetical protein